MVTPPSLPGVLEASRREGRAGLGCLLKAEPTGCAWGGFQREIKDDAWAFKLNNWVNDSVIY